MLRRSMSVGTLSIIWHLAMGFTRVLGEDWFVLRDSAFSTHWRAG